MSKTIDIMKIAIEELIEDITKELYRHINLLPDGYKFTRQEEATPQPLYNGMTDKNIQEFKSLIGEKLAEIYNVGIQYGREGIFFRYGEFTPSVAGEVSPFMLSEENEANLSEENKTFLRNEVKEDAGAKLQEGMGVIDLFLRERMTNQLMTSNQILSLYRSYQPAALQLFNDGVNNAQHGNVDLIEEMDGRHIHSGYVSGAVLDVILSAKPSPTYQ